MKRVKRDWYIETDAARIPPQAQPARLEVSIPLTEFPDARPRRNERVTVRNGSNTHQMRITDSRLIPYGYALHVRLRMRTEDVSAL